MKKRSGLVAALIAIEVLCLLLALWGCSTPNHEGFAIYLTKEDIPPSQMPTLSHVDISEQPIIEANDVITYNAQTYELKLTSSAFERISQMDIPVRGKSFVVCVDRKPIYWGAFWTPVSSISFDGVTIWKPFSSQEPRVITLTLGYPSSSFYGGEDPRNNPEVISSLEQAGKFIPRLSIAAVSKLASSMKGYELYSWSEDGQWNFTLITGTDRNKTPEEIVSGEDFISETGWVRIHVTGVDAIDTVLSKLPQSEHIFWLAGMRGETAQGNVNFTLPDRAVTDNVKEQAQLYGLNLAVQTP
jgi:hypothetical protein